MTLENVSVAAVVAVVVSLLLEWFPGLNGWWERFTAAQKRGLMAAVVAVISLAVAGVNCAAYETCPADWLRFVVEVFLVFLGSAAAQRLHLPEAPAPHADDGTLRCAHHHRLLRRPPRKHRAHAGTGDDER